MDSYPMLLRCVKHQFPLDAEDRALLPRSDEAPPLMSRTDDLPPEERGAWPEARLLNPLGADPGELLPDRVPEVCVS